MYVLERRRKPNLGENNLGAKGISAQHVTEVVQTLEEDILLGRIYPRERLVEENLATRFDIKRHVVRLALAELETAGLVVRSAGKGVVVMEYKLEEVEQLYDMRDLLESEAARRIPYPVPDKELMHIQAAAEQYSQAVASMNMRLVIRANKLFHELTYALCGNIFLSRTIDQMAQRSNLVRFSSSTDPTQLRRACDEHFAILAALRARDRDHLAGLCIAHIQPARDHYVSRLRRIKV